MLLIFDLDGTLVDSEVISLETLSLVMGEWGHPMTFEECLDTFMGRRSADNLMEIERRLGRPLDAVSETSMRERMKARLRAELKEVRGVAEVLARLDVPRCVASSSSFEHINESLAVTGLAPFFGGHIFSASQVEHGKPAPDLFLLAAQTMGEPAMNCVVVEDSIAGVTAGRAAGMHVVGFNGASHARDHHAEGLRAAGARWILSDMAGLPDVLAEIASMSKATSAR